MTSNPIPDPLAGTSSITLIVHGVGDHSAVDIRKEARTGLAIAGLDPGRMSDIEVPGLPQAGNVNSPYGLGVGGPTTQSGLQIELDGNRHVLLPIEWSGLRLRAGVWADKLGLLGGLQTLMLALPALFVLCCDMARCTPRGRGLWKLALAGVSLLFIILVAAFTAAAFWLTVNLPLMFLADDVTGSILCVAGFIGIAWLTRSFSVVLDLAGDVARYVSSDPDRREAARILRQILGEVAWRAPEADILVIAHSLGSVLATEAISETPPIAPGKVVLLTCGSPLRLMSAIFPNQVKTPEALASCFVRNRSAVGWCNLWRGEDWIGKSLNAGGPLFQESTMGAGLHPNYWNDERLWKVVSLLLLGPAKNGETYADAWKSIALTGPEATELAWQKRALAFGRGLALGLLLLFLQMSVQTVYADPWPGHHDIWSRWLVRAASVATMGFLCLSFWIAKSVRKPRPSARQWLWDLRSAGARSRMLFWAAGATAEAVFLLDWLARAKLTASR